jgi:hypothetical protein
MTSGVATPVAWAASETPVMIAEAMSSTGGGASSV